MVDNKKFNSSKAITLISLIITIVIMLILAAVTISLVIGKNGLFTKSKAAIEINNESSAVEKVQMILSEFGMDQVESDKTLETFLNEKKDSKELDKVINNGDGSFEVEKDGYKFQIASDGTVISKGKIPKVDRTGLKVGDYINYTPDIVGAYTSLSQSNTGSSSNSSSISQDPIKWQILRIYDDGSMDIMGTITNQYIYFSNAIGYNNGVYLMNDICEKLYSKGSLKARSVNINDFEYWLKKSNNGISARAAYNNGTASYNDTHIYNGSNSYRPDVYDKATDNSDEYYDTVTTKTYGPSTATSSDKINVTQTYYNIYITEENYGEGYKVLGNEKSNISWVATRYTGCFDTRTDFGLRSSNNAIGGYNMFYSDKSPSDHFAKLHPVVTLGTNVKVTPSDTATNSDTPHIITAY